MDPQIPARSMDSRAKYGSIDCAARSMDRADPQITPNIYSRVRKDYTPLHVYLGCVWVVIPVKYITYEGLLHNTLALDVDTVQEAACSKLAFNA